MKPSAYEPHESLLSVLLAPEHVHVWCVSLAIPENELGPFERVLSPEERSRADRFKFAVHRQHFVSARGVLRYLLSHYAKMPPARIRFQEGAHGKPELTEPSQIRFNVSHSGGLGLYAIAHKREVGVDIEQHRTMDDLESVAKHYFARDEVARLETLSPENRNAAFFRCWSRKEAFVKALGAGLSLPLDSFCVSIDEEPDAAIHGPPVGSSFGDWRLFDVTPGAGYSAALVTEGMPEAIYCARVEDPANLVDGTGSAGSC